MKKINTNDWKEFVIGELFEISRPIARSQAKYTEGNVPFVASGNYNNGIVKWCMPKEDEALDLGNCITVSPLDGSAFYQKENFLGRGGAGSAILMLRNDELTELSGLFIASVIRNALTKYSYSDQLNSQTIADEIIWLPIVKNTEKPDYTYMEQYMQNILNEVGSSIENLSQTDNRKHKVNISEWKEFVIGDLFEKLQLGIKKKNFNKVLDVSEERTDEFNLPLINAKHSNNGVMYFGREEDFETAEMTIDIVQNGAIATGDVYAQPQKTGVLWDAYLIKSKQEIKSPEALLFISAVLEKTIKDKFSYDDKCVWDKASLLSIKLPVDNNGNPDYTYMELYMKSMMDSAESVIEKFESLDFIEKN